MGKKAKKAQEARKSGEAKATREAAKATRSLEAKRDASLKCRNIGGLQSTGRRMTIPCSDRGPLDRDHRTCNSEFYEIADLFGIAGSNPDRENFKLPQEIDKETELKYSGNPIYIRMTQAITQVLEVEEERILGKRPGSEQSWPDQCQTMRESALSRLRHQRKQKRYREKKKQAKTEARAP